MRVLLVEDDGMLGEATAEGLRQDGHAVDWVQDGEAAKGALHAVEYDVLILDLGLPRASGLEVLRWMRQRGHQALTIVVTARDLITDRVQGLDSGADDYLVKPFDLDELSARIRAIKRRTTARRSDHIKVGDVDIDLIRKLASRAGVAVDLTAREFALVEALVQVPGCIVPKAALEERLYGFGDEVASNTVEVFIHHLRRKLGEAFIVTVRGRGYRVAVD